MKEKEISKRFVSNLYMVLGYFIGLELLLVIVLYASKIELVKLINNEVPELIYALIGVVEWWLLYKFWSFLKRIVASRRFDILVSVLLGISIFLYFNWFRFSVATGSNFLSKELFGLLLIIGALSFLYVKYFNKAVSLISNKPTFLSDDANSETNDTDFLDVEDHAYKFAEQVLNNKSKESIVFGLDAPWGAGKTTYLKFAKNFWKKDKDITVWEFSPQSLPQDVDIFNKFINEFRGALKENGYFPEVQSNLSDYLSFLNDVKFSFKFFDFHLPLSGKASDALEELKESLRYYNKKIIVIIDDLDRLPLEDIKTILNIVKKSFVLPNITYILCYDTENINSFEDRLVQVRTRVSLTENKGDPNYDGTKYIVGDLIANPTSDNRKLIEFFEKVVNVKISLFPDPVKLKEFLFKGLAEMQLSERTIGFLMKDAFTLIFDPSNYHLYRRYIGDIRKIKRLLNTIKLLDCFDIDFSTYDYNPRDLINLLLIYINYPQIFRKIYETETNGGKEFFSVVSPYAHFVSSRKDDKSFYNSTEYENYVRSLNEDEAFLIEQTFNVKKRFEQTTYESIDPEAAKTYACFNGSMGTTRNLESHLNLIVKRKVTNLADNYKFYVNKVEQLEKAHSLDEVFSGDSSGSFDLKKGDTGHKYFFSMLNELPQGKIKSKEAQKIIDYILNNVDSYSLAGSSEASVSDLREDLVYRLLPLLDRGGWEDEDGKSFNNSTENIRKIADQIFGEREFSKKGGILELLTKTSKKVLGIYDLVLFRLLCSHDRQGQYYNVYRALGDHFDKNSPMDGLVTDLAVNEMREISQNVFSIFKERYVTPKINFFREVDQLTQVDLLGKLNEYVEALEVREKEAVLENAERMKSKVKSFTIYQLSNKLIQHGVGCGYYDENGNKDKSDIHEQMQVYLLETCFNLDIDPSNAEIFIEYMFINYSRDTESKTKTTSLKNQIESVLDLSKLKTYWNNNKDQIKTHLKGKDKTVYTLNSIFTYKENLEELYKELDLITV